MPKSSFFIIILITLGLGCKQPNRPVPAAHTDTFIEIPAADTVITDTIAQQQDTLPADSSLQQTDTTR